MSDTIQRPALLDHRELETERPPVAVPYPRAALLGVRVDDVPVATLIDRIAQAVAQRTRLVVVNANAHLVMLAQSRSWLREFFARADIAFCDGAGVQLAIRLLDGRKMARHTPPQWIEPVARRLAASGASMYWLGGKPGIVQAAARRLASTTGVAIAGTQHGYFDMRPGSPENEAVLDAINRASPDLLLVNMGMPMQEEWLAQNWDRLDARVAITAGALVDHLAGHVRRPPPWVADAGLEWAVRLAAEPRRLWRRYVFGLPSFAALVLRDKLRRSLAARSAV